MGDLSRRGFMRAGVGVGAGGLWLSGSGCAPIPLYEPDGNGTVFTLGVLSGLHSPTEVVLWTRLEPDLAPGVSSIDWQVSTTPDMGDVVRSGNVAVSPDSDWTAKVLADGLDPDRSYWYRFGFGDERSPIGRARTLPLESSDPAGLRLAFASCQNWGGGWYNAWAGIAAEDVDAVLWLGDYIYEAGGSVSQLNVRRDPVGSVGDLAGYRAKYRLYRSDPLLQAGHAAHPFVPIWDDHEVTNDYTRFTLLLDPARGEAAYRAWFEYMPVWPIDGTRIHRSLRWGRLAELFLLDTRQYRDLLPNGYQDPEIDVVLGFGETVREANEPGRTILGDAQRAWLLDGLDGAQTDSVRWKLVGNQVMIAPARAIDLDDPTLRQAFTDLPRHNGLYWNVDSWDGYQWERDLILGHLADAGVADVAFLTGDIHTFWQAALRADFDDATSPVVANEFVGGGISSQGPNVIDNDDLGYFIENLVSNWSPAFRYSDMRRNGYGLVNATADSLDVSYRVTKVKQFGVPVRTSVRFAATPGAPESVAMTKINP